MNHALDTTVYTQAREAAETLLARKVSEGSVTPDLAHALATAGLSSAIGFLTQMLRSGLCAEHITDAYQYQLAAGRAAGDEGCILAAEFTLAVWDGLRADIARAQAATN